MTIENTGVALARRAADALRALGDHGPRLAPDGADRFLWSADVLDELARVASLLGEAVDQAAGEASPEIAAQVADLSTAIVAHRNSLLRHGCGVDPFAVPRPRARRDGPRTVAPAVDTISGTGVRSR